MSAHTPGPWSIRRAVISGDFGITAPGLSNVLAEVFDEFVSVGQKSPGEARANANLIAAAPDLLAALEGLMENYTPPGCADPTCGACADSKGRAAEARAAIAKARGES